MLTIEQLSMSFGKLHALSEFDLTVSEGEILSLIGPNGAGKTTFFNLVTGTYRGVGGRILFRGEDITHLATHKIAQRGIARSFQQTFLFAQAKVLANVMMGCHMASAAGPIKELLRTRKAREMDSRAHETALEILDFMGLTDLKDEPAGALPHGHQRSLGVAIALACRPSLLLLDEPVTGMNPTESAEMVRRIHLMREKGITIILVEHAMDVVMGVSDRIVVLSFGRKIAEGRPEEIKTNPQVIEAYLGRRGTRDAS